MPNTRSTSLDRRIQGYPNPKQYQLLMAYIRAEELGVSEALNIILRDFFNRMPEGERNRYLQGRRSE